MQHGIRSCRKNRTRCHRGKLSGRSSHQQSTPVTSMGPTASLDLLTPLPPVPAHKKHGTPKGKKVPSSGSMATLLDNYQQSHSCNVSPAKNTPTQHKKNIAPNHNAEPPNKKQCTSSLSSERDSDSDNSGSSGKGGTSKHKKKRKKDKSNLTAGSNSEVEETEEQQEKCQ